ncbi:cytochrome c-type biogenesis protein CcmH [Azospirillum sp. YIM B02556]|uniref:Cytochrome c-type biogenesis protein n=1 Tax=Azospirillum endophyticum TaxID=2800326 RepID=A0ABS1F5X0_9PROT|nr:cytochrome c-type biogenesis protein [Azospirillum endophyticum]MBK1838792.1 cytochrome c-type biogenesis protein CcmH [Azospirillum endophyticum]
MKRVLLAALLALSTLAPALAVQPDEVLPDPALETRARAISQELRCLVCQNQSIDDSNAPLARDLRLLVRDRLKAGDSDTKVMEYVTDRYGDYVLLRPPFKATTLVLWVGPFAVLLLGAAGTFLFLRGRRGVAAGADTAPLSADERRRLDALLRKDD